ncbi:MAG TPA: amidase [Thermoanaerobaculia bacterium]|nr:amidase [Thermoanaerobaculia bacterium]
MAAATEGGARWTRRRVLHLLSAAGAAVVAAPGLGAEGGGVSDEAIAAAAELLGLELTGEERALMREGLAELRDSYETLRQVALANEVPPALTFDPRPAGHSRPLASGPSRVALAAAPPPARPRDETDLAFLPVHRLARLVRSRQVSSRELTRLYLDRISRLDPLLHAVIAVTEERALTEADRADRELAAGVWRGPLHGIPWGAKDLLAAEGYPTTWGATPFREQVIPMDATVVQRLQAAGAVLVAKLTLGELAWGDVWFGGKTANPWNLEQGSSGSSAGPAAATAAAMVGFAIGSETWGSIVSPSARCGVTGLRPTFGRVSRHGAMALSWSMDKIGPLARTVEDCALAFGAIHGADGHDPTVLDVPFRWPPDRPPGELRVGFVEALFDEPLEPDDRQAGEQRGLDLATLDELRRQGFELVPVTLPELPVGTLSLILTAEAAAAFDELTRSGRDELLVRQVEQAWPNVFRQGRLIPAVEYLQANRVRTLVMRRMNQLFEEVDAYVAPSFAGQDLLLTNLTGHPAVVLPNGFRSDGTPGSITFTGGLFGEGELLALARRYQEATGFHLRRPAIDATGQADCDRGIRGGGRTGVRRQARP